MKKLVILALFAGVFGFGCKKDGGVKPPKNPDLVTVTIDTTGMSRYATINPLSYSVEKGGNVVINVNVKVGNRINKIPPGASLSGNIITISNVNSSFNATIGVTDSLTVDALNARKALFVSSSKPWFDDSYRWRITGVNHLNDWNNVAATDAQKTYYDIFHADGTYDEYGGGSVVHGTWNMAGNGKSVTLVENITLVQSVIPIDGLTSDALSYFHLNWNGQGKDWEVFVIHH